MNALRRLYIRLTVPTTWDAFHVDLGKPVITLDGETLEDCWACRKRNGEAVVYRRATDAEAEEAYAWWATR